VVSADAALDGRVVRGQRSRDAVVAALLELIDEGDLRPTAQRISERAGVSLRSLFHHFDDLESLFVAAADAHRARLAPALRRLPRTGPLHERIAAFVEARAALHELSGPVSRAARLVAPDSPAVSARIAEASAAARREIAVVFAIDGELVDSVAAVSSWEAWDMLRRDRELTPAQARAVVARLVTALLEPR
jgi:AcrR family transcriptional regulator